MANMSIHNLKHWGIVLKKNNFGYGVTIQVWRCRFCAVNFEEARLHFKTIVKRGYFLFSRFIINKNVI